MEVYFDSVFFLQLRVGSIHFYFMYFEAILLFIFKKTFLVNEIYHYVASSPQ